MKQLTIGFTSCPNDTFIFYGLIKGGIGKEKFFFKEKIEDIETLNYLVMKEKLDVSKVSIYTLGYIYNNYILLNSGAAIGRGCGPIIVSKKKMDIEELEGKKIAVPGKFTTATLLLGLFNKQLIKNIIEMPFSTIMHNIKEEKVSAGIIIHEGRFTYSMYGLHIVIDLGLWWEQTRGLPLPLGGIVARKSLSKEEILYLDKLIVESIKFAKENPYGLNEYIKNYAQELSDDVIKKHINLYVNEFSYSIGKEGKKAIKRLLQDAEKIGLLPYWEENIFL